MSPNIGIPHGDFAMTFEEIAEREGVTKQAVSAAYQNALKKLRKRPDAMNVLRGLVELMQDAQQDSHRLSMGGNRTWH